MVDTCVARSVDAFNGGLKDALKSFAISRVLVRLCCYVHPQHAFVMLQIDDMAHRVL